VNLALPLIAWGAADDISGGTWFDVGTPLVLGGQADPFGGLNAYLLNDNDAVVGEARRKRVTLLDSVETIPLVVRQGTATTGGWALSDFTSGGVNVVFIDITAWAAGVPTIVVGVQLGAMKATLSPVESLGGGWYVTLATFTGVIAGNLHDFIAYPAATSALGGPPMGTTYFYMQNLVLLDLLDEDKAWRVPREGSKKVRARTGTIVSHIKGWDYRFQGKVQWVPTRARSYPVSVSGFAGLNESIGVNCGVNAMLNAGQQSQSLTWAPDRSACSLNIASELVAPFDETYDLEPVSGDRTFSLELRNVSTPYPTML
jgi:hypothetical protein